MKSKEVMCAPMPVQLTTEKNPKFDLPLAMTEKTLPHEEIIDAIHRWLCKHHGPSDAGYLRSFLGGSCEHPYHAKKDTKHVCDLCGG